MNGTGKWLLGICAFLVTAAVTGSFGVQWTMSKDVSAIAASMSALSERVDRMDSRWTVAYDNLDGRLRDVEIGER